MVNLSVFEINNVSVSFKENAQRMCLFPGKGHSIWDYYTEKYPEKFAHKSNGNIACDSYHKSKEDVKILNRLGVNFYKFSISWSRILPDGYSNNRKMKGIMYYNNLIEELISKGKKKFL